MIIEGKELTLVYGIDKDDETYALKNVNIKLTEGEMVGIIGPSGSGKSSLLYILSGMKTPTTGNVFYKDMVFGSISDNERAKIRKQEFGFIFQRHFLIDYLSVIDNVLVTSNSKEDAMVSKAMTILEKLNIKQLSRRRPYELSGGQRQRVAIARALINNPKVIFADEPTASLDHKNAMEVMSVIEEYKQNSTILIVTHDRSILQNSDRVISVWDGCIKEEVNQYK
ncbi:MAG: ABC transporter ATP-binding protein [Bacillota bacterium]|nr:ABC transporter ATP-binding protein [Bacillota bacterium]